MSVDEKITNVLLEKYLLFLGSKCQVNSRSKGRDRHLKKHVAFGKCIIIIFLYEMSINLTLLNAEYDTFFITH